MVQMNRVAGQKLRYRCREQTYGHQGGKAVGGDGGGVMNWEIEIDLYTLICIKWITNKNLLYKKKIKLNLKKVIFEDVCISCANISFLHENLKLMTIKRLNFLKEKEKSIKCVILQQILR